MIYFKILLSQFNLNRIGQIGVSLINQIFLSVLVHSAVQFKSYNIFVVAKVLLIAAGNAK